MAIANGPQPALIKKRYSLKETHQVRTTKESVFRKPDDTDRVVMFSSSAWQAVSLTPFYPPDRGDYRFRISAQALQSDGKPITYRVDAGLMLMTGKQHLVGYFDAPPDRPNVVEFVESLEPRNTIRLLPYDLASAQAVKKIGAEAYEGPGLAVNWIEAEGPLYESWPPASHRRIFGDLPQKSAPVYNQREPRRGRFRESHQRCPANPGPICPAGLSSARQQGRSRAVREVGPNASWRNSNRSSRRSRVGLLAVMVSPEFLFLREEPGKLDDFALASRLSYFLWSTMPDEELLELAEAGKLSEPETLARPGRADAERSAGGEFHEEFRRPMAEPARHRLHPAEPTALSRIRRHAESLDGPRSRACFSPSFLGTI